MCNVVVVFRTATTVGRTLHILPYGTVSIFYIANLHILNQHAYGRLNLLSLCTYIYCEYNYADNPFLSNQNITWEHYFICNE